MLRNAIVVFAIVLVLGSSGLSTTAFARGGAYGDGAGGDSFRGNHFGGGFGGTRGDGYGGYGNPASGLRGGSPGTEAAMCGATGAVANIYVLRLRAPPVRSGGNALTTLSCSPSGIFAICRDLTRHTVTRRADQVVIAAVHESGCALFGPDGPR